MTVRSEVNENDPRVKRTRQMLLQAFYDLATEKDMRSISVQDITERATLNRATFYAHFSDKEALMDAALRSRIREALVTKFPADASFSKASLGLLFRVVCDAQDTMRRRCPRSHTDHTPVFNVAFQKELYAFILEWIRHEHSNGWQRHSPETLASLLSWSLFGTATEWSENRTALSQETVAIQIVDLLADGLGSALAAGPAA